MLQFQKLSQVFFALFARRIELQLFLALVVIFMVLKATKRPVPQPEEYEKLSQPGVHDNVILPDGPLPKVEPPPPPIPTPRRKEVKE